MAKPTDGEFNNLLHFPGVINVRALPFVLGMIAVIVAVDVLFLRHQTVLRLIVNIGLVLLFGLVYFLFLKK